jgi:hypothetical protein
MQPTPQTQDTAVAQYNSLAYLETEAERLRDQLGFVVAPEHHALLKAAIWHAVRAAEVATFQSEQEVWRKVLAHVPGIVPALEIVAAHVTDGTYCCEGVEPCPVPPYPRAAPAVPPSA